ncbi:Long-chain-fatty-acid--CoA ligase [Tsuneonella dongtanensis]|uniref:3-methylmercaptopropionyl-CoA ligase n=1 Tax=Tsuneonella dongtanensis TaxID=692370 RepID=A0A1B2ADZ3_9SPHN|nr:AMP-binding protein [Tsuneonella dongtanensis]ANY20380.1 Long-chain-fatty-acid--CoA ligase [Tsuneonella dongtanensis]
MYHVTLSESHFPPQTDVELRDSTVGSILRDAAVRWPDAIALEEVDESGESMRTWTYAQLNDEADALATALLTRFRPGERIVLWANNVPEWIICAYAFGMAGIVLVTANPGYQPRELDYVVRQSSAVAVFVVESVRGNPIAEIARTVADDIPAVREITDIRDRDTLFATGDLQQPVPEVVSSDIAQIQYTSGSTGFPKGVLLHHRGLVNNALLTTKASGGNDGARVLLVMPLFHTAGCMTFLGLCQRGGHLVMPPMFDPALANLLLETREIEELGAVPTMLQFMLDADAREPRDFSSMRVMVSGGAMVAPELIRRVETRFGCPLLTVYGLTEASPIITLVRAGHSATDRSETVGQANTQCEISIRDPQSNTVVPVGVVGEICARGYMVMAGYNDNPEATAATIDAEGWLHTGDLGTMDERGFVKITGRLKEMIIRGGENLFPVEIENVLLEHGDVAQVAVVGLPDETWGEIVAAFVLPREGITLDLNALKAHCRAQMAAQKTPSVWVEVDEYPLTGSGKVQKFTLRDRYLDGFYDGATIA